MDVKALMQHSAFKLNNPNRVRSLIHAFCLNNPAGFHQADGSAYRFWIECVIALDKINPQVAARLARALDRWPKFAKPYSKHMLAALHHVAKAGHYKGHCSALVISRYEEKALDFAGLK
jgi:aminopeptidase N